MHTRFFTRCVFTTVRETATPGCLWWTLVSLSGCPAVVTTPSSTGGGESRCTVMSMETQSLLLCFYLLITVLFPIRTTVNLLLLHDYSCWETGSFLLQTELAEFLVFPASLAARVQIPGPSRCQPDPLPRLSL